MAPSLSQSWYNTCIHPQATARQPTLTTVPPSPAQDGHAKGGGALSAVAQTGAPIAFYGTGEHFDDLEPFNARSFVSRLLGYGDMSGLIKKFDDVIGLENQEAMLKNITQGVFSMRDMYDQFQNVLKLGPLNKVSPAATQCSTSTEAS